MCFLAGASASADRACCGHQTHRGLFPSRHALYAGMITRMLEGRNRGSALLSVALLVGASLLATGPAHAADTVTVRGSATATSTVGTSIVSGDVFTYEFVLDLSSQSTSATSSSSRTFNDAVQAFSFEAADSNDGTWDPAGITWDISPVSNLALNENSDALTLQVKTSSGAPQLNGVDFFDLVITLNWEAADVDVQLSGGTQTLAEALGTSSPDPTQAQHYLEIRDTVPQSASFTAQATAMDSGDAVSTSRAGAEPAVPGGFLTITGNPGEPLSKNQIVFGGVSLRPGSAWVLEVTNPGSGQVSEVITQGALDEGGHGEFHVPMTRLAPGQNIVVFRFDDLEGNRLTLGNIVRVTAGNLLLAKSPETAQPAISR